MDIVERLRRAEGAFWTHERRPLVTEAAAEIERLRAAAKAVEDWWLSDGMDHFVGAPYAIFAIRAALVPPR